MNSRIKNSALVSKIKFKLIFLNTVAFAENMLFTVGISAPPKQKSTLLIGLPSCYYGRFIYGSPTRGYDLLHMAKGRYTVT